MAVDRPTFSESWYRVASLRPRLRSTVQTYRQHYRGEMWHVVRDPGNNQFFRLNPAAYHFVGMLDGRRNVEQVWNVCNEQLGDQAPTQGEAIQLMGQLYASNLLASELPADAAGMFDRYKKRIRREVRSYMQNLLFIRIPLIDPDRFLDRWVNLFGLAFTKVGLALWLVLMFAGFSAISGRWDELFAQGGPETMLNPDNLVWLYLAFALIKGVHELGHAFSCKKFGKDAHSGGEVHTIGIMFLVFMPVPYVDASSSWALRSKWQRMVIGAAGMYMELAVAALAAIVWANTGPGPIHAVAFNMMFVASVSTILFNGNPLLRYDAYYILSDLIEIPNLSQRSKEYLYYLVKKYLYGVRKPRNPGHTPGEKVWMVIYGIASSLYRVVICAAILLFVADKLFVLGMILAAVSIVTWVFVPMGKWMHYLATSPELLRTRNRALAVTFGTFAGIFVLVGMISFPERGRVEGVIEPRQMRVVYLQDSGFIEPVLASNSGVAGGETVLLRASNRELETTLVRTLAERDQLRASYDKVLGAGEPAQVVTLERWIAEKERQIADLRRRLAGLEVRAPIDGTWVSPDIERVGGSYMKGGDQLGVVATIDNLFIRAVSEQPIGPRAERLIGSTVEVRVKNRPDIFFHGTIENVSKHGKRQLPSPALSFGAGGAIATDVDDRSGTQTTEEFFEVQVGSLRLHPDNEAAQPPVFANQRVVVLLDFGNRPLMAQWWDDLRRLVQKRFHTTL